MGPQWACGPPCGPQGGVENAQDLGGGNLSSRTSLPEPLSLSFPYPHSEMMQSVPALPWPLEVRTCQRGKG